jgi:hypothetical protein
MQCGDHSRHTNKLGVRLTTTGQNKSEKLQNEVEEHNEQATRHFVALLLNEVTEHITKCA